MSVPHPTLDPAIGEGDHRLRLPGDVRLGFDAIEASGFGWWRLLRDGEEVAIVQDLEEWPGEEVRKFRAIQFGKDPAEVREEVAGA